MIKNKAQIIVSIMLGLFLVISLSGCTSSKIKYISSNLKIDLANCKIERQKDSHGGFLGDGDYFAKIICTEKQDEIIKSKWKKLPLSTELQKAMDIIQCDNKGCNTVYEKYNIPDIKNGYYYFQDRHSDSTDSESDEQLNARSSYNFSVGIYDSDNRVLYYYELDT